MECVYMDDCEGVAPSVIEKYYGMDEDDIEEKISDSNNSSDSDSGSDEGINDLTDNLEEIVATDIQSQVHHSPVPVPKHENPFTLDGQLDAFHACLKECLHQYSARGVWRRRGTKELQIPLPIEVWYPKAELWVQAMTVMTTILEMNDG
ncbi:hypothetical protein BDP27DRAFT_1427585 [Rhodocollybia butyracea]|uniref:Uncharacterized protein n=1 Tax=Rhodocollybia butyracea TaxID=206335 RepID=A0A9P5PIM7_9AGAR|nr:hypothetical protein BDP27DRAFT_1427585 [Rhodocollybia butyracea]